MISELKRAFEIGFLLFLPFLIIDLVVASVLMSMGMMMLPPVVVSLPFKLIFFVLVDGWTPGRRLADPELRDLTADAESHSLRPLSSVYLACERNPRGLAALSPDIIAEEIRHGIRTRIVALAAGHPAANHHPAGDLLAPLVEHDRSGKALCIFSGSCS